MQFSLNKAIAVSWCNYDMDACYSSQVQREGDELDAKIKKTEAELAALENTCEALKLNNEEYRRNLCSPLETAEERETAAHLQQLIVQTERQVRDRRLRLLHIQAGVQAAQAELGRLAEHQQALEQQQHQLQRQVADSDRELSEQEAKLDRAVRFNNHVIRQLRRKTGHVDTTPEEQDIEVRLRREEVQLAARSLCQLTELDEEARQLVVTSLEEGGISVPDSRASSSSQASRRSELTSCVSMESVCSDSSVGTPASQRSELQFPSRSSVGSPAEEDTSSSSSRSSSWTAGGAQTGAADSRPVSQQGGRLSVVNIDFSDLSRPSSTTRPGSGTSVSTPSSVAPRKKTKTKK